jgi:uncharacterized repeat protein (TIGR01451 family)
VTGRRISFVSRFAALLRRPVVSSALICSAVLFSALGSIAYAVCIPTAYTVTASAPPPSANWTDTVGLWQPTGGFPGCAPGDSASNTNFTPTTIVVNSSIPNPIIGLNLACSGCVIDVQGGGDLTIEGAASIGSGASLNLTGGTVRIASGGSLTIQPGGSLLLSSGELEIQSGGQVTLDGSTTFNSSAYLTVNGGTLTVPAATTLNVAGVLQVLDGTIDGSGTIAITGVLDANGPSLSTVSPVVNNNPGGTVSVSAGTLQLTGGGNGDAPFTIAGDTTLDFPSGTYTLTPNGVISGPGTLSVSGATLTIGGVTQPGGLSLSAGTINGPGFLTVDNLDWSGGTMSGSGGTQLAGNGLGNINGSNGPIILDGRSLNIYGYCSYTSTTNNLVLTNNAPLSIFGTFDIQVDGAIDDFGGTITISPNGVLYKSGGSGTFTLHPPTTNNYELDSFSGNLELAGTATHNGFFYVGVGATLTFSGGSNWLQSGSLLVGDGAVAFPSGGTTIDCPYSVQNTTITGGWVDFSSGAYTNDFTLTAGGLGVDDYYFATYGTGTWSGGVIYGGIGTFFVESTGDLTIDASVSNCVLSNIELHNDGTINYTAAASSGNAFMTQVALITNDWTFDIQTDQPIPEATIIIGDFAANVVAAAVTPSSIENYATFVKSSGTGTTAIAASFENSGTVEVQTGTLAFDGGFTQLDGNTNLAGGNIAVTTTLDIDGGVLEGAGTITGDVTLDDAEVNPGDATNTGVIAITGSYTQGSGGVMNLDLAGPGAGQFDQVTAGGTATLGGTVNVALLNSYEPPDATTWTPVTAATLSGTFSTQNLPTYGAYGAITSNYTPTSYVLTAVVTPSADVSITKSGPANVTSGQNITYTVTITNNGPDAAANVVVTDPDPANTAFVLNSGGCTTPYPCSLGTLAIGQTITITSTYSTSASFSGNVTNTATVASTTAEPNSSNNSASANTNVGLAADVSVTKTGPPSVAPGQDVVYTIVVTNNGPSPATSVTVSDTTPTGLAFLSNSGACTGSYPCNVGTLAAGQSATITSTYTVPSNYASPSIVNTATVSANEFDANTADNTSTATTTVTQQADLSISKTGPSSAGVGQNITYTITVSNLGPSSASGVTVSDTTPAGLTFVSNSGACTGPFPCSLGTLAAGQSATIVSTFNIPANYSGSSVVNTASVASAGTDPNTTNDSSTLTTGIVASADLGITKTGPGTAVVGQPVSFTVVVTNNGTQTVPTAFVTDPTPSGLTFVSNSGGCTTSYPCTIGPLAAGQSITIVSNYIVAPTFTGPSITNTASVSSATFDPNSANDSDSEVILFGPVSADLQVVKQGPGSGTPGGTVDFTVQVTNNGPTAAPGVVVSDPTPPGLTFLSNAGACNTPYPCNLGTVSPGVPVTIISTYVVSAASGTTISNTATVSSAATDSAPANNSSTITMGVCALDNPVPISPASGATVSSPITFEWTPVSGATGYTVIINGSGAVVLQTSGTSITASLPNGNFSWTVVAEGSGVCGGTSATSSFVTCNALGTPRISVVGTATTTRPYTVAWTEVSGASSYELQESTDESFSNPISTIESGLMHAFTKNVGAATPFFYRVRPIGICNGLSVAFTPSARVVVIPLPSPTDPNPTIVVPVGTSTPLTFRLFIPGIPPGTTTFVATVDKPWLSVLPTSGVVGPEGVFVNVGVDPSSLPNGTWTGTVLIVYGSTSVTGSVSAFANTPVTKSIPVSVSLVTPITSANFGAPTSALVIPSVAHLDAGTSRWESDVRLTNISSVPQTYSLIYNAAADTPQASVKQTTLNIPSGTTTALDDIIRSWYGFGHLADSSSGTLAIQALDRAGKPDPGITSTTVVTSRAYNASAAGTLGQFIPAIPFASFLGRTSSTSAFSIQQISQSSAYRTNLGVIEASGSSASILITTFDALGRKLLDLPLTLRGGEQKQLNSYLAASNISLNDGRAEVKVLSGEGKVSAYASVVDNQSNDPLFVSGSPVGALASRYVVAGVADLNTGTSSWRSDVRIFNGGTGPQTATLTLYPNEAGGSAIAKQVVLEPGQVKTIDGLLRTLFDVQNAGGTLHVTTNAESPLIVTARTYNQTANGTLGQFIAAVTPNDAVGVNDRALQLTQAEESVRYRTNVGLAEVTGKPVVVELSVVLPDSKVSPSVQMTLAPFESKQLPLLRSFGFGAAYNARITVRVVEGTGKITAYGSLIDMKTDAPTYIPAQ